VTRDGPSFRIEAPTLQLPKGGGAIRDIGETFAVNGATGAGTAGIALPVSPGRDGFGPALSLTYDSGTGNGPFGFGWSLQLPAVTRSTENGLPRYDDANESDDFVLSGMDRLVPALRQDADGSWVAANPGFTRDPEGWVRDAAGRHVVHEDVAEGHRIRRYRPRIETAFARIERWSRTGAPGDVHWRMLDVANVLTIFGSDATARIADPADPRRIFAWLLSEVRDDRGNLAAYLYREEDGTDLDLSVPQERNRGDAAASGRRAQRYLKRILYGNRAPALGADGTRPRMLPAGAVEKARAADGFMFEVVFDYGDHDTLAPTPHDDTRTAADGALLHPWPARVDAFSTRRPGFELRTSRLCRRILMFHHFPAAAGVGRDCLVRATEFRHGPVADPAQSDGPVYAFLNEVVQAGFRRSAAGYERAALPAVSFAYATPELGREVRTLDSDSLANLPDLDGAAMRLVDLHGEGLPGILAEAGGAWCYKRNISPLEPGGPARFTAAETLPTRPAAALADGELMDLGGTGRPDLVVKRPGRAGLHAQDEEGEGWGPFRPFALAPGLALDDPQLRVVDLDGDGRADLLITRADELVWHPALREVGAGAGGFGADRRVPLAADEEAGPRLLFAGTGEAIHLADMTGDGLADIVRIRAHDVAYWPNLGHGRFGAKITMDNPPALDGPRDFDPSRVRLADLDGSGTTDLLYLAPDGVRLAFNQSGNGWSRVTRLPAFPGLHSSASVGVADLLGNGTACLVWASRLPGDQGRQIRYVDLMGRKPHLLVGQSNNCGGETRIEYAPSTRFYLADRRAGRPWATRLPFPVQVVARTTALDHIARTRFVSTYRYSHGSYDAQEREFRGFGLVEREDSESFLDYVAGIAASGGLQDTAADAFQDPVTTRSWGHTGTLAFGDWSHGRFAADYDPSVAPLPGPMLPPGLAARALREALRALKGAPLREEVFSRDGSARQHLPYRVAETRWEVRQLQPAGGQRHAVFHAVRREALTVEMDREPDDPRIVQSFVLDTDRYGHARRSCTVVHGRQRPDASLPAETRRDQARRIVTCTETDHTRDIERGVPALDHRLRTPCAQRVSELTGLAPAGARFRLEEIRAAIEGAAPIDYADTPTGATPERRPLSERRMRFLSNALAPLGEGQWDSLALVHRGYALAYTPDIVAAQYGGALTAAEIEAAGYVHLDGDANWWIPSGTAIWPADPAAAFWQPTGLRDPFGLETVATRDADGLLTERVELRQAAWQVTTAINDYRTLGPVEVTDANGNRSAVAHDALGRVVATALMGKAGAGEGDTLADPTTRFEYDDAAWVRDGTPRSARSLAREEHGAGNPRWQEGWTYFDGAGRVALAKAQAEPGKAFVMRPDGTRAEVEADPRWVGTGRVVLNNKGRPVRSYEPYFSANREFEAERELRETGVSAAMRYDPLGRPVRTDFPDDSFTRLEHSPWRVSAFDANDTVLDSRWYADRGSPDPAAESEPADPARRAAWLTAKHAATPSVTHLDALGRRILTVTDHGGGVRAALRTEIDATGARTRAFDQGGRQVAAAFAAMSGQPVVTESAERGRRWTFHDVAGVMLRSWDEHGRGFRVRLDTLRRPTGMAVRQGAGAELVFAHLVYGDALADGRGRNLLGAPHLMFDTAGVVRVTAADFRGRPARVERILARDHRAEPDWTTLAGLADPAAVMAAAAPALDMAEIFAVTTTHDALDRPRRIVMPDGTVMLPAYAPRNLLASLRAQFRGQGPQVEILKAQEHDAAGRRLSARLGNDVIARVVRDPFSLRVTRMVAHRAGTDADAQALQDLRYTHDPVGNVTELRDAAQQTHYFANAVVEALNRYEYDAAYRLVRATGREHAAATNDAIRGPEDLAAVALPHPNDAQAVRRYTEEYTYDLLGNIRSIRHRVPVLPGLGDGWTRRYRYAFEDAPGDPTNRLTATSMPGDADAGPLSGTYTHDVYGNMTRMPHLPRLDWSFLDRLRRVDLGGGGEAHYVHGMGGVRQRKVVERPGERTLEWIFLGPLTLFRRRRRTTGELRFERATLQIGAAEAVAQVDIKIRDEDGDDPANAIGAAVLRFRHDNHLGSAVLETDAAGQPISYEEYHPFGTTAYRSARPGVNLSLKRYRFSGKERDDETGFYDFGARCYAPWLGRWISADPAGFVDGPNLFRYCANNPPNFSDPDGMQEMDRRFGLPRDIANVPRGATPADIAERAALLRTHVENLGYAWTRDGMTNPTPIYRNGTWNFGIFDPDRIPAGDPLGILRGAAPPAPPPSPHATPDPPQDTAGPAGDAATATAGAVTRAAWALPDTLRGTAIDVMAGNNLGLMNADADVITSRNVIQVRSTSGDPVGTARGATNDAARYIADNPDTTAGRAPRAEVVIPEDAPRGAEAAIEDALGGRAPQRRPNGSFIDRGRPAIAGDTPIASRGLPLRARTFGAGLGALGFGLSAYSLVQDIRNADVAMGVGDAVSTAAAGTEVYGLLANSGGAMRFGLAGAGVGMMLTSGVRAYREFSEGDTLGGVVDTIGVVGGGMLLAAAIIATGPIAAALAVGGVAVCLGVAAFHLFRGH
jgi:RHS repeat-associated protein